MGLFEGQGQRGFECQVYPQCQIPWVPIILMFLCHTVLSCICQIPFLGGVRPYRKGSTVVPEDPASVVKDILSSVAQSCLNLCDPMDCSTPGFPVHHQLPEPTQTQVQCISDAIQLSHPLLSSFPTTFNLSQQQGLFQWDSSSHQVAKVLEFQLHHQSFQRIFRTDFL